MNEAGFMSEVFRYASRVKLFEREDWKYYIAWVGLMSGLFFATGGLILVGFLNGAEFPAYVWNIPLGTFTFVGAIAFDTIGHQTVYKEELKKGEGLVHQVTIFSGVASCIVLCLAYHWPEFLRIPAGTLIVLSIFYSVIDEAMHWHRYLHGQSDRVEMWSHFFIFLGHIIMIWSWWTWFEAGYPGLEKALEAMKY